MPAHVNICLNVDLLAQYSEGRERIEELTTMASSLTDELDQLTRDIEEISTTLRDCIRTP